MVHDKLICSVGFTHETSITSHPYYSTQPQGKSWKGACFQSHMCLCITSETAGENEGRKGYEFGCGCRGSNNAITHRRVPRMTSSMDPVVLDWLRLGTSGRRVRGGGFLRRADCAGRDSEEELCSRVRRGRGLLEVTTLEPGLCVACSSGSLCEKKSETQSMNGAFTSTANWPCSLPNKVLKPWTKTWHEWGYVPLVLQNVVCLPVKEKQDLKDVYAFFLPIQKFNLK